MRFVKLEAAPASRETLSVFGGYNANCRIGDGELAAMENLCSDRYPLLSTRKKRGIFAQPRNPQGLIARDSLCWVDGSRFVINGYGVELGLSERKEDCPKRLLSMGAYVVIFPDKKYINTLDLTDFGNLEAVHTTSGTVTFTPAAADGAPLLPSYTQPQEPENPENMALWLDTSQQPPALVQWSAGTGMWVSVESTYCTSIAIDQTDFSVTLNGTETHTLSATVQPVDCTQIVKWYTSNTAVVTVDSTGKLTPVGVGTATITAKCGTQSDTMTVTVVDNSVKVYFGYYSSWSYNTPSAPLLAARSDRGYSSSLSSDNLHKHNGEEADSEHSRAIRIEPGCTYKLRYSGTDTNWYEGWCILSDTEKLKDYGWQNIGSSKEVTINNTYETGIYLYISLKYGSAGTTAVTDTMLTEFISRFTMERVM